jgi:hypothetical protein
MSLRSQQYAGDYDAFEIVNMKERTDEVALHMLATRFKQIMKEVRAIPNTYIGDIKAGSIEEWRVLPKSAMLENGKVVGMDVEKSKAVLDRLRKDNIISEKEYKESLSLLDGTMTPMRLLEAKKELKFHIVRWTPPEVERGFKVLQDKRRFTLEEAFSTPTITKMDVISLVQNNRYTDFSMIYYFRNKGTLLNPDVVDIAKSIKENIYYYTQVGNPFKALKRKFALAKMEKDAGTITKLTPILNSDLGRIYHVLGDIGTLIHLLEDFKPDQKLVRFEIDQFRNRLANVYQLKDYLKEEHTIIGEIESLLKAPLKSMLPKLEAMEERLDRILKDGTNRVLKGKQKVSSAMIGGAKSIQSQGISGWESEYNRRLKAGMGGMLTSGTTIPELETFINELISPQDIWKIFLKLNEGGPVDYEARKQLAEALTEAVNQQYADAREVVASVTKGDTDAVGTALASAEAMMNAAEALKSASPSSLLQMGAETLINVIAFITSPDFNKPMGAVGYSPADEMKGMLAKFGLSNAFTNFAADITGNLMKAFGYKTQAELNQPVVEEVLNRKESETKQMLEDYLYAIEEDTKRTDELKVTQAKASAENRQSIKDKRQYEKDVHFTMRMTPEAYAQRFGTPPEFRTFISFDDWMNLQRGGYGVALMDRDRQLKVYPTLRDAEQQGGVEFTAGYPWFKVVPLNAVGGAINITNYYPVGQSQSVQVGTKKQQIQTGTKKEQVVTGTRMVSVQNPEWDPKRPVKGIKKTHQVPVNIISEREVPILTEVDVPDIVSVPNKQYVNDLVTITKRLAHFYSYRDPATALGFRMLADELWRQKPLYEGKPKHTSNDAGHQNAIDFTMESMLGVNRRNRFAQPNPKTRYANEVGSLLPKAYADAAGLQPRVDKKGRPIYNVPPTDEDQAVFYLQDAPYIRGPTMYQ